ncbi:hypothetical protein SAMN05421788_111154 [Filimonas lacunae]|uniref:Uncharacterized protein n=1 Tax=Filimonas lacunae TaxID=477680 RepID=A0A173MB02_9BACT|nr:hypothetical protein [Filimonas lacunae]BAV04648.1 hypothetical protein FLA_0640 [Filimonas lacunae]SIT32507.1 hypothetical protein SAMN05421788_111154 [Filimonas lacunae]
MVATLLKPKPSATLDVQLIAVQAHNNIVLSQNGQLINPHLSLWNNKNICTAPVPVAFNIGCNTRPQLAIQLAVGGNATRQGVLEVLAANGTLLFYGEYTSDTIVATACYIPEALAQLQDDLLYMQLVLNNGHVIPLGTIPVEMYWINLCELPDAVHKNGTPVELLNTLCEAVTLASYFPAEAAYMYPVQSIVQSIFNTSSPVLDIHTAAARFVTVNSFNQVTLHYNAYFAAGKSSKAVANSYDKAALLQYMLQCYGYRTYYCLLQQAGFVSPTRIAGHELLNSTFSGNKPAMVATRATEEPTTSWDNHAFVYLPAYGVVADAALGPHMGYEMMPDYIEQTIDNAANIRHKRKAVTEDDVMQYTGVVSVDEIYSLHRKPDLPHTNAFISQTGFSAARFLSQAQQVIAGKWPEPAAIPYIKGAWVTSYTEVVPGKEEVLKIWMLQRGEDMLMVKLYVSSGGNALAYNRFVAQGSLTQCEELALQVDNSVAAHCAVSSNSTSDNRYLCIFHNAVLDITCSNTAINLSEIAAWYIHWASNHLVNHVQNCLPGTSFQCKGNGAIAGAQFIISLDSFENTLLHFSQTGNGLRLLNREPHYLVFEVQHPSIAILDVIVMDSATLLVNATRVLPAFTAQ